MPTTIEVKVYTIDELSEKAKEKARSWWTEGQSDYDFVTEDLKNDLDYYGFPIEKVYWSLSSCQGDGVAFEGDIDFEALLKTKDVHKSILQDTLRVQIRKLIRALHRSNVYLRGKVIHEGRYYHWNSMSVEVEGEHSQNGYNLTPKQDAWVMELRDAIAELCKDLSRMLEKTGYSIIEESQSPENVDDELRANEVTFLEDGTHFRAR